MAREAPSPTGPAAPAPGRPLEDYQTVFTNAKAGMEGVDMAHVKRVVAEMSQGSAHYQNEQRKQAQVQLKIDKMKEHARTLSPAELQAHTLEMDRQVAALEAGRNLSRTWVHVDMDAFFAAVEELANPALKHVPMAVGGMSMISTANYPARKFGVRSAMPGFIAKRLCPELVFVEHGFQRYKAASDATRVVFARFDPEFEAGSLDEAYLDVTDYCEAQAVTGAQVAAQIRACVQQETGLTCSCGVAPNKMLAKVCSDLNKPNGQYVLPGEREQVVAFIGTLPVRKVPGVGKVTEQMLGALGVRCCKDLYTHRGLLAALFQPASLSFFLAAGLGLGATHHTARVSDHQVARKGISCERTFRAMSAPQQLMSMADQLVSHLCEDLDRESIQGNNITLKLKATDFKVTTHAKTLHRHVHTRGDILPVVRNLLQQQMPCELRLMGVRLSGLRRRGGEAGGALDRYLLPAASEGQGGASSPARRVTTSCPTTPTARQQASTGGWCPGQAGCVQHTSDAAGGGSSSSTPALCRHDSPADADAAQVGEALLLFPVTEFDTDVYEGCGVEEEEDQVSRSAWVCQPEQQLLQQGEGGGRGSKGR